MVDNANAKAIIMVQATPIVIIDASFRASPRGEAVLAAARVPRDGDVRPERLAPQA